MSDWIEDAAKQIEDEKEYGDQRAQLADAIRKHSFSFWWELKERLRNDVLKINKTEALVKKMGGDIEYRVDNEYTVRIEQIVFPAIRISVSMTDGKLEVEKETTTLMEMRNGIFDINGRIDTEEENQIFQFFLDGENLHLKDQEQRVLRLEQVSQYLLEQLIVPFQKSRRSYL